MVAGFLVSMCGSVCTVAYCLLRKDVDGTDMTEVFVDEEEEELPEEEAPAEEKPEEEAEAPSEPGDAPEETPEEGETEAPEEGEEGETPAQSSE